MLLLNIEAPDPHAGIRGAPKENVAQPFGSEQRRSRDGLTDGLSQTSFTRRFVLCRHERVIAATDDDDMRATAALQQRSSR